MGQWDGWAEEGQRDGWAEEGQWDGWAEEGQWDGWAEEGQWDGWAEEGHGDGEDTSTPHSITTYQAIQFCEGQWAWGQSLLLHACPVLTT